MNTRDPRKNVISPYIYIYIRVEYFQYFCSEDSAGWENFEEFWLMLMDK